MQQLQLSKPSLSEPCPEGRSWAGRGRNAAASSLCGRATPPSAATGSNPRSQAGRSRLRGRTSRPAAPSAAAAAAALLTGSRADALSGAVSREVQRPLLKLRHGVVQRGRQQCRAAEKPTFRCMASSDTTDPPGPGTFVKEEAAPSDPMDTADVEVDLPDTTTEMPANLQDFQAAVVVADSLSSENGAEGTESGVSRHMQVEDGREARPGAPYAADVGVQAEPGELYQVVQAAPAPQQLQPSAAVQTFAGINPTMILLTLVLSTFTALGASMFAMLKVMQPALKSTDKAAKAMEAASKDLQKAAKGMEKTSQMFQSEVPEMIASIETTSKEFTTLGRTLNGVSGGWRKNEPRSKSTSKVSRNGAAGKTGISIRNQRVKPSKDGVQASVGVDGAEVDRRAGDSSRLMSSMSSSIEKQAAEAVSDVAPEDAWYTGAVSSLMGWTNSMQGAVQKSVGGLVERFDAAKKEEANRRARVKEARRWISDWRKRNGITAVESSGPAAAVQPPAAAGSADTAAPADIESHRVSLEEDQRKVKAASASALYDSFDDSERSTGEWMGWGDSITDWQTRLGTGVGMPDFTAPHNANYDSDDYDYDDDDEYRDIEEGASVLGRPPADQHRSMDMQRGFHRPW